jgi:hypothetical protein
MQTLTNAMVMEYGLADEVALPEGAMMDEIAGILKRHGALDRFGLAVVGDEHMEGQVMNERCLLPERWLVCAPKAQVGIDPKEVKETKWRLDVAGMLKACANTCEASPDGPHLVYVHKEEKQQ